MEPASRSVKPLQGALLLALSALLVPLVITFVVRLGRRLDAPAQPG